MKPGEYAAGDLKVRVCGETLPPAKDWGFALDLWQHPWAVARTAKAEPFSEAHYAAMKPLWEMLAGAGQKFLTVTLVELPWNHQCYDGYGTMVKYVRGEGGRTAFDWTRFDRYVEFGKACGLGPYIACYTMCPWGYKVSWEDADGKVQRAEAKPGTAFFREYWEPFLKEFSRHLKEKGWLGQTYIALDERTPEDLRLTAELVRECAPGLKIAMAGDRKPSEFKGIEIDCYSQALQHVTEDFLEEAREREKAGKITTFYVCCWPMKPNTFMGSELDEAFWCGAYAGMKGMSGLLRWAYNSWPADAAADATYGNWMSGDTFLVYPGGEPSMRFLMLKNGIQQAEKMRILRGRGERSAELEALAARYDAKAAMKKSEGGLRGLVRDTLKTLNR